MKKVLLVLSSMFLFSVVANAQCGEERWPVKTLADSTASRAAGHDPVVTTVKSLVELKAPTRAQLDAAEKGRFPAEMKTYSVKALVLGYKKEADSDFHIVIADPTDKRVTMIAEIPSKECGSPDYAEQFGKLQEQFTQQFSKPGAYKKLAKPVLVSIVGVGFFDFLHGQTGVAKNGFELHPVLSFTKE